MAIEKKSLRDVSSGIRGIYQKALEVISKGAEDYGIELLKGVVQKEPGFMDARNALRDAERRKANRQSPFTRFLGTTKSLGILMKGRGCLAKKPMEAL